jgi:hypothetical protein
MKMNNTPSPIRLTRDDQGEPEPRRERTTYYEHARQARDNIEDVLVSTQALDTNDDSNSSDSSMSSASWRNHGDGMVQQVHESMFTRSDTLSPLCVGSHPSLNSPREWRNNNRISLIDLIDEALAILDDVSDDGNDSNDTLGSIYRKQ